MELLAALERASAWFAATLGQVRIDQWDLPTPDPGWSVLDLVTHVVGGNRRYVVLLTGAPTEEVEALRSLNHLGDDALQAFVETAAAVGTAFRAPGAMQRIVHHRLGDRTGADLLVMRVIEHAVHGWDLARAIHAGDRIDADVTDRLLAAFAANPALLTASRPSPANLTEDADPQRRLLIATGRAE